MSRSLANACRDVSENAAQRRAKQLHFFGAMRVLPGNTKTKLCAREYVIHPAFTARTPFSYHDVCLFGFFSFSSEEVHLGVSVLRPGRAQAKEVSRRFEGKPPLARFLRDKRGGLEICNITIGRRTGDRSSETSAKVPGSCSLLCVFVAVLLFIAHSFQKDRRSLNSARGLCRAFDVLEEGARIDASWAFFLRLHVQPLFLAGERDSNEGYPV